VFRTIWEQFKMNRTAVPAAVAFVVLPALALAQSGYSGMQERRIKALSDQQIADLQAGRGMGFALPAELNGYPGPTHVLELADKLELAPDQRASVQALFDAMKQEATPLGLKLIQEETELDRQFASRTVTPESLNAATIAIGKTQAELRETHLKYHLTTGAMLSEVQRQKYAELRGYGSGIVGDKGAMHHHH
jgi:hypothetical protein